MEGRLSVGLLVGIMLSIPMWLSLIGWIRLIVSAVGFLSKLRFI
ncbi:MULTISPECIES: hypothetical protein [unclassified Paenibacillus]|nr:MULTISPECIES: hypothetical protein [unclassified Paenibacillus]MBP1156914.1 hypothetical protein [Paenibacillus sp. PvP091]MBP1172347.1 hypothetical protein [Paenibacillus sp. PvR098]MBP2438728.1 hypothetical protein [Paenibacillus sp. PvP052]